MDMDVREATLADRPAIRDVARRSLQASYSLGVDAIVGAVDEWYDENRLNDQINDEDKLFLLALVDDEVVAFSDSEVTGEDTGELFWIHVDPNYRSQDIGEVLFEQTREHLAERGAPHLHGRVLAENVGGNEFYKRYGLVKVGEEEVDIEGTTYVENVYAEPSEEGLDPLDVDGTTVYVDRTTQETGSIAPFHVIYTDEEAEEIWGYWCSKCQATANAMDSMGRIQCDQCGNARKPTRWDAAYL
jgi:ribosomal protein S18 acetylase RimI-like enzyme